MDGVPVVEVEVDVYSSEKSKRSEFCIITCAGAALFIAGYAIARLVKKKRKKKKDSVSLHVHSHFNGVEYCGEAIEDFGNSNDCTDIVAEE